MEMTQTAEYALRAMAFLAALHGDGEGRPVRTPDLARAAGIPPHYLSKVMRRMVVARLVRSRKGHGGGFTLARPAAEIRFVDVLLAAGYPMEPDRCAFGWGRCNAESPCPLHPTFSRLNVLTAGWAQQATLGEVPHDPRTVDRVKLALGARPSSRRRAPAIAARSPHQPSAPDEAPDPAPMPAVDDHRPPGR
jgi:Rrf2 family iron-sulfur cluster assembly transcriptional regulator